jgi:Flp pilus assembly protein TadD
LPTLFAALARLIAAWHRLAPGLLVTALFGLTGIPAHAADAVPATARDIERLYRGGDTALAMQRVDAALAANPGDPALRFLRGVMLSDARREAEAIEVFSALTRDFPEMPEPYNNLAVLRAARGDLDGARALLEDALRRDPAYATAQENLGDVLVRQAQRAYEAAASAPHAPATLQRKLALVRALDSTASTTAR